MTKDELWQAVLGEIELAVSKASFTTWFKNTEVDSLKNETAIIRVPNTFTREWLENKYNKLILRTVQHISPEIKELKYIIGPGLLTRAAKIPKPGVSSFSEIQIDQERNLNPRYTFESFVVGSSNELAQAACLAVCKSLGSTYNPLFIYGGVGLGKTHLLQAIGNEIIQHQPDKKVKYIPSETFTNELVDALKNHVMERFKNSYRKIDLLIIDDVQFLAGKEKTQEEFFHTFNTLYSRNKQIILSSDRPPKAIPTLEERLRSRFEGGMIADIGYPDLETRMAILKTKAEGKNFDIPDEVINYIASNFQHNVRELEGALNHLNAHCQIHNLKPDIKLAQDVLIKLIKIPKTKATTPKQIIKIVADFYGLNIRELAERSRKKQVTRPRQIAMYLMRNEIKASFPNIGQQLGNRDHTTAIYAFEKIKRELTEDESVEQEINLIREKLYSV